MISWRPVIVFPFSLVFVGVNITSNWLGYIVIWYTEGPDNSDEIFGNTSCKLVPKVRTFFFVRYQRVRARPHY